MSSGVQIDSIATPPYSMVVRSHDPQHIVARLRDDASPRIAIKRRFAFLDGFAHRILGSPAAFRTRRAAGSRWPPGRGGPAPLAYARIARAGARQYPLAATPSHGRRRPYPRHSAR